MNNLYRRDGWVKSVQGPAIPGAQIWVCSQPANTDFLPPTPLVSVFSDPAGLVPITQPIITDGFGHYDYYVAPGLYTEIVAFGGKVNQVYPDQSVGNVGTAGSSLLVLSTNGTPNFSQTALNFVQGSGVTLVTDNLGNMTISGSSITYPGNAALFLNGTGVFSTPPYPTPATMTSTVGGLVPTPPNDATKFLNGAGAFSSPSGTSFSSAGQGWFWGGGSIAPAAGGNAVAVNGQSTTVRVAQLMMSSSFTVRKISTRCQSGVATCYSTCGIYSFDGLTKLVDAGANVFNMTSGLTLTSVSLVSPVVLSPGVYWFAWGSPYVAGAPGTASNGSMVAGALGGVLNKVTVRVGTAANALAAGVLPATLGAITGDVTFDIPGYLFEV